MKHDRTLTDRIQNLTQLIFADITDNPNDTNSCRHGVNLKIGSALVDKLNSKNNLFAALESCTGLMRLKIASRQPIWTDATAQ